MTAVHARLKINDDVATVAQKRILNKIRFKAFKSSIWWFDVEDASDFLEQNLRKHA